jgi:hypothetical protein
MTRAQRRLTDLMRAGNELWWFGDHGPQLDGLDDGVYWPQRRTVRALLRAGVLRWCDYLNQTQRECGICRIEMTEATT